MDKSKKNMVFYFLLAIPGLFMFGKQMQHMTFFSESGIADIRIGDDITKVKNVIPFKGSQEAQVFLPLADPGLFYVYNEPLNRFEVDQDFATAVEKIFFATDTAGHINRIYIFLKSGVSCDIKKVLSETYGDIESSTGVSIQGVNIRQHNFWSVKNRMKVYLYLPMTEERDAGAEIGIWNTNDTVALRTLICKRTWGPRVKAADGQ